MLKLYNTLSRKKEEFIPLRNGKVGMYSCGLTVYGNGHVGNYRAFVSSDVLRRYLEYSGYKVKKVVNITDVDDKTIKNSIAERKELNVFTKKYIDAFFEDEKTLNILPAHKYPKATEHIKEMINIIKDLLKKKLAYKADDGIYFNIGNFKDYGKLSKVNIGKLKSNIRIDNDEYDKDNVRDFALWKFYNSDDGKVFWDEDIGKGRPGWHIECSAMSSKYLGQPFDIHTGGVDLVFPHHENEIAQSEGCCDKKFVNYWIHNEWMMVDGKKMSKSLGNFYTVRDLINKGYDALALRYFYLTGHYRNQMNFTLSNLENSENSVDRLRNLIGDVKNDGKLNKKYLDDFERAMNNDLDTPRAINILWKLVRDKKAIGKIKTIERMDKIFGLELLKSKEVSVPDEINKMIEERESARKKRDWRKSDMLREEIRKKGFVIEDSKDGWKVSKI